MVLRVRVRESDPCLAGRLRGSPRLDIPGPTPDPRPDVRPSIQPEALFS